MSIAATFLEPALTAIVARRRLQNTANVLLVLVNGEFVAELSDVTLLPKDIVLRFTGGVFLSVPDNRVMLTPIHLLYLNTENIEISPQNFLIAGINTELTVLEEHYAHHDKNYVTTSVTHIEAKPQANIQYHKIQQEGGQATHCAQIVIDQRQDSRVKFYSLALGAKVACDKVNVNLMGQGASCKAYGFYQLSRHNQHIDNHILIEHKVPGGDSTLLYKGIADKKSRAGFSGKVLVHQDAQKTQSYQANHNLLLSSDAEVSSKPEFEIYADDVKCAHGATIGQIDQEALFYLRARGINAAAALKLLTEAFAMDVLEHIKCQGIKDKMQRLLSEASL